VVDGPLPGGAINEVVRVGETVRRPPGARAQFVHALLGLLGDKAWASAPRFLGIDDRGREILSFVDGHVPWQPARRAEVASESALVRVAELVRELHDLTAATPLAGEAEVVCHNDLSPRNTVYRDLGGGWTPVALIDWDLAAPGERIHDVAHMCWQYLNLGPEVTDVADAARRLRVLCDAYELADRDRLVDTILWWQDRCWRGIEAGAAAGQPAMVRLRDGGATAEVRAAFAWVRAHRTVLERNLLQSPQPGLTRPNLGVRLDPVAYLGGSGGLAGAVGAAVEAAVDLGAVADHPAPAVLADRRHQVDRALEAVEDVPPAGRGDLDRLVVVVAADLACRHGSLPSLWSSVVSPGEHLGKPLVALEGAG
jgi:hypothetical protein